MLSPGRGAQERPNVRGEKPKYESNYSKKKGLGLKAAKVYKIT